MRKKSPTSTQIEQVREVNRKSTRKKGSQGEQLKIGERRSRREEEEEYVEEKRLPFPLSILCKRMSIGDGEWKGQPKDQEKKFVSKERSRREKKKKKKTDRQAKKSK